MTAKDIIMASAMRVGVSTQVALAKRIGMPPPTLCVKLKTPELFTGHELGAIMRVTQMADADRLELLKHLDRGKK